jgi:hypothetical protein
MCLLLPLILFFFFFFFLVLLLFLFIFFFYSCCSHLEHRAFEKRFVSLQFLNLRQSVGLPGRGISSSQGLYLNTGQHKHRINTYTHQTSMPCFGFEPTIPASERAKTVYASDRSATVTGNYGSIKEKYFLALCCVIQTYIAVYSR